MVRVNVVPRGFAKVSSRRRPRPSRAYQSGRARPLRRMAVLARGYGWALTLLNSRDGFETRVFPTAGVPACQRKTYGRSERRRRECLMGINRRGLLCGCLGGTLAAGCGIARAQDIFPQSIERKGRARKHPDRTTAKHGAACANLAAFGYGESGPGGLSLRSGVHWFDALLGQELYVMRYVFQIMPAVFFFDDGANGNALATTQNLGNSPTQNGTVLIGRTLTSELLSKHAGKSPISSGDHALGAVVAHEWAHILQFTSGSNLGHGKAPELHADFMAGWYQAGRVLSGMGSININFNEAAEELYGLGDFDFNSPQHHGTPDERLSAYVEGSRTASRGVLRTIDAFHSGLRYLS